MTGVRFELTGAEAALATLAEAAAKAERPRELYDEIGGAMVASTQQRFEDEVDPDGNPWPDSLRKKLLGGRTLTEIGILAGSFTHEPSNAGVAWGTNVIYAAIHQLGGTIRAKTPAGLTWRAPGNGGWVTKQEVTIPARPFLGLDDEDEAEIEFISARFLGAENDRGGFDVGR